MEKQLVAKGSKSAYYNDSSAIGCFVGKVTKENLTWLPYTPKYIALWTGCRILLPLYLWLSWQTSAAAVGVVCVRFSSKL